MPSSFRRLLIMNATTMIIFIYIGIFVNLYIWEQQRLISDVAWFNFVLFLAWGVSFTAGAKILARMSIRFVFGLSAISAGSAFLMLSYLHLDNRFLWITIIGLPVGMMWGFYAIAQNITLSLNGKGKEFSQYFAAAGFIGQVLNMTVPLMSAQVIRLFGYSGSFTLMLVLVTLMFIVSFFVPKISLKGKMLAGESVTDIFRWRKVFFTEASKWLIPSCLAAGFFLQFQGLFALLFTFSISLDKLVIALLNTLYTVSTFAALYIYRRYNKSETTWLNIAIALICLGFLLTLYPVSPLLVLSNILTTVGLFYFSASWNALHFRMISEFSALQQTHILVWRENLLAVSRCAMLLLVIPIKEFRGVSFWLLLALTMLIVVSILYFQKRATLAMAGPSSVPAGDKAGIEAKL
ncbi:MFS transporter [Paenibacillus eucommiae]|uniref:MFS family permease n=1 Tax=Paenibacillus eucommiae TaxID=1355755 RepID=A0ABS4JD42_9BACL|nr:MFS transporter [Paenibacillus eucommiae]MBP1997001.1 MFS family permease [Paenibacillus eucommiae]